MKPVLYSFVLVAVVCCLVQSAPTERSVKVKNAELKVVDQSNNHDPEEFNWR